MRSGRRRWLGGTLTVVVLAAAGVTVWATTSSAGASYRTAVVARGTVQQTLTTTGALSPIRSADAAFQVAGTVAKVKAAVGRKVTAGDTLARLNRSSLKAALTAARSALSNARTRLSDAQTGQVSDVTSPASTTGRFEASRPKVITAPTAHPSGSPRPSGSQSSSGSPRPTASGTPRSSGSTGPVSPVQLEHDQAAVVIAQHATDLDLAAAKTALATETKVCAAQLSGSTTTSESTTPTGTLTCAQATAGLLHDQDLVNDDENAVDAAELTLSRDLASALKALQQSQKSGKSTTTGHQRTTTTGTSPSASFTTASAADLATDQASIDNARASVATAKADLRQATLTAPISGTITAVTIGKGDTVGSTTATPAVEIVGSHQDKATISVSDTEVRTIKLGMHAQVTPDGSSRALTGRVVGIGATGTESDSGSVTYPVTVDIVAPGSSLVAGADAAVSVTLATASDVMTVPTSSVHYQGSTTYVEVMTDGKPVRRTVKVSAVGASLTEVVSGLTTGQRVVLADLNAAVPSSSTTLTGRAGFGGAGGFGGPGSFSVRLAPGGGKPGGAAGGGPAGGGASSAP